MAGEKGSEGAKRAGVIEEGVGLGEGGDMAGRPKRF